MTSKPWASKCFIYRRRKLLRADGGIRVSLQYLKFCKIRKDDWRARADAGKSLGYESEGSMEELHDLRPWVTCNCVRREMRRWRRASRPWQDFLESVPGAKMEPSCGLLEERGIISCSFSGGGERDNFNRGRWRWSSERLLGEMLHSSSLSLSLSLFFCFFVLTLLEAAEQKKTTSPISGSQVCVEPVQQEDREKDGSSFRMNYLTFEQSDTFCTRRKQVRQRMQLSL